MIAKPERLYRQIGRSRSSEPGRCARLWPNRRETGPGSCAVAAGCTGGVMPAAGARYPRAGLHPGQSQTGVPLRRWDRFDRYLRVAPGGATHDLLAMAHEDIRTKLRSAVQQANQTNVRTVVTGGRTSHDGQPIAFSIDIYPVTSEGEPLLLICFVQRDDPGAGERPGRRQRRVGRASHARTGTRGHARRSCRTPSERWRYRATSSGLSTKKHLSVQEEFQSTNEELLTSKEELQSLNEELTALNSQLQETLEKQRTTANDLQNVLYSTDVATIFLDAEPQNPLFHASHAVAVQCHSRATSAGRSPTSGHWPRMTRC